MIRVTVMYPNEGGRFDLDYYMNIHIPLTRKLMDSYGLVKIEVDKGIGTAKSGDPAPFVIIAHLVFNSLEEMQKGIQDHDPELLADVPNYTDIPPVFQVNEILEV